MADQIIPSTYERIIPYKRLPYWVFWPIIGFIAYLVGELIIRFYGGKDFPWTQLIFSGGLAVFPMILIWMSHNFQKAMRQLSSLLWDSKQEFEVWLEEQANHMFTLRTNVSRFVTAAIVVFAIATVLYLGLPLDSLAANVFAVLAFTPFLIVCGQGAFVLLSLLGALRSIVVRPVKVPFYRVPHPAINNLHGYYSSSALLTTVAYIGLVIAVWQGPYGLQAEMQIWLTLLALYPFGMFIWSFFQVHTLLKRVKDSHLEVVNHEVQRTLAKVQNGDDIKAVERLEKVMHIQDKVNSMRVWTWAVGGTLTLLATLGVAGIQVTIAVLEYLRP